MKQRSSAVLLHITSLPSPYGIGAMGRAAFDFIDFLSSAGVKFWQMLPLNPTGAGNSPYQSESCFAGSPALIDLDMLCANGLLKRSVLKGIAAGEKEDKVDFAAVLPERERLLRIAFDAAGENAYIEAEKFSQDNKWAKDYALYKAIKKANQDNPFWLWDKPLRDRETWALEEFQAKNRREVSFWLFVQHLFFRQFTAVKEYAVKKGVGLIGDIPIYVSGDSADVWANRGLFVLDEQGRAALVAGVPPDAFTDDGQLWGNPVYNWDAIRNDNWNWWIDRVRHTFSMFDMARIDHFRGFDEFWAVEKDEKTAKNGRWIKGPGMQLFDTLKFVLGDLPIIAEDLGILTDSVRALLHSTGFPGMKVMQFAFTKGFESDYLPHRQIENSVCYTGTHDNDTLAGWFKSMTKADRDYCSEYLRLQKGGEVWQVVAETWKSPAFLAVTTAQDLLALPTAARTNTPGTSNGDNWSWRLKKGELNAKLAKQLKKLNELYFRT